MYHTSDFRGTARDPLRLVNMSGQEILSFLKTALPQVLKKHGVPAVVSETVAKSGGLLGSKLPMLVVRHPSPPSSYFEIGFLINGNVISFPLLGHSAQNTKLNMQEEYRQQGKMFRSLMSKPDEFILQQEQLWEAEVLSAFDSLLQ